MQKTPATERKQTVKTVETTEFGPLPMFGALDSKTLALVDLNVLRRITKDMQKASFREIQENFICEVHNADSFKDYLNVIEDELRFHKTVNDITTYDPEEVQDPNTAVVAKQKVRPTVVASVKEEVSPSYQNEENTDGRA